MAKTKAKTPIPPLIKRNTMYLASSQAFTGAGGQMVPTLAPLLVTQMIGSAALAGIGTSITGLSRLIIAYPIGRLTDTYGRKSGVILGLLLVGLGASITGIAAMLEYFPVFLLGILVMGLGTGAVQQLRVAATDMFPPNRRAEGLGYVLTGSLVGAMIGPVLIRTAEAISDTVDIEPIALAWFFVPFAVVISLAMVMRVRPDPKEIAANLVDYYPDYTPPEIPQMPAGKVGILYFLNHYPKLTAFVSMFCVQGNMNMMMTMTALALRRHDFSLSAISLSVAIHVMGMFGLSLPLGRLADRVGRRNVMLLGLVLASAGSWFVVATPSYTVITTGTFLVGLGWSCVNIAATALYADTTSPSERGRVIGANDTFTAAAAISMPLVGGVVVEYMGMSVLGIFGMALMVPALLFLLKLREPSPGVYEDPSEVEIASV
ncbi:MAG: MFS transporter [SAR202 cluster bacterium]|nr:MFS transporter [SAR202 cluster bacterium]